MEIKNNKKTVVTGRHIMIAASVISFLCSAYWLYISIFTEPTKWTEFFCTLAIGFVLLYFSKRR